MTYSSLPQKPESDGGWAEAQKDFGLGQSVAVLWSLICRGLTTVGTQCTQPHIHEIIKS